MINNTKCNICGKICGSVRGLQIHSATHASHKLHGNGAPPPESAAARVSDALQIVQRDGKKYVEKLQTEREQLMARVAQIDGQIQVLMSVQSLTDADPKTVNVLAPVALAGD